MKVELKSSCSFYIFQIILQAIYVQNDFFLLYNCNYSFVAMDTYTFLHAFSIRVAAD